MPYRRCRKASAIFLCWVMTLVFWFQGMVYPVNGELGVNTFEIVNIEMLVDEQEKDDQIVSLEEENTEVQEVEDEPNYGGNVESKDISAGTHSITIAEGETLWEVAGKYQTTIGDIVKLNGLTQPDTILVGQKLLVPLAKDIRLEAGAITPVVLGPEPSRGGAVRVTNEELELLARVIHAEARGEDFEGQIAVGAVVLNRVEDDHFPDTINGVVYQQGAFTAVIDKQIHLQPNESAYKAAEAALRGEDPTHGALYYYNPKTATDRWIKTRPVVKTIGNHTFSI